ncbi:MAG TPA: MAPEG family protein [Allosphingosinicella sp.]|nr:MAPEG family protein [Allosphingosinicella sp.]
MHSPILAPVVALVAWTLVMMLWMIVTRIAAMRRKGISLVGRVGTRTGALEGVIEDQVNWKAHNYTHLVEQPTIFYAVAIALALMDFGGGINLYLAWAYVGLRIAHSLVQATVNIVLYRFILWILSSLALVGLTVHAGAYLLHHM